MSDEFIPLTDHIERMSDLRDKLINRPEFAGAVESLEDCLRVAEEIGQKGDFHEFGMQYSRFIEVYEKHKSAWDQATGEATDD